MTDIIQQIQAHFWWLLLVSIGSFIATIVAVPMLLVRIPADYFAHDKRQPLTRTRPPILVRVLLIVVKNTLGAVLILIGLLFLLTPGQGLLTMLVGLMLMNYPGKYQVERWLISRPPVYSSINWLRQRAHREPLIM